MTQQPELARFRCPACGQELALVDAQPGAFSCASGHHYTADALLAAWEQRAAASMASAIADLNAVARLLRLHESQAADQGQRSTADTWRQRAEVYEQRTTTLKTLTSSSSRESTSPIDEPDFRRADPGPAVSDQ